MHGTVYNTYREYTRMRQRQVRGMFTPSKVLTVYDLAGQGFRVNGYVSELGFTSAQVGTTYRAVAALLACGIQYDKVSRRARLAAVRMLRANFEGGMK